MSESDEPTPSENDTPQDGQDVVAYGPAAAANAAAQRFIRSNRSAILQALTLIEAAERMQDTINATFINSPIVEIAQAMHESDARLAKLMADSPVLETVRALERQQAKILETGQAVATVNVKTVETFRSISEISTAAELLTTRPSAIIPLNSINLPVYDGALDAITRTHRDLTRSLDWMNDSWHKGLLNAPWPNVQLPTMPLSNLVRMPETALATIGAGVNHWMSVTQNLHRLLRSWKYVSLTETNSFLAFLARSGFMAALRARDAVVHGDTEAVAEFIANWLHLKPTPERIEAVSAALLEEGWETEPSNVLKRIPILADRQRRALRPVWETQLAERKIGMLTQPIGPNGLTLGDLAIEEHSAEDIALKGALHPAIETVMDQLKPDELEVAQVYMLGDVDWLEAAQEAGHPGEFGRRVNRKLKRLGNQYTARHGRLEF